MLSSVEIAPVESDLLTRQVAILQRTLASSFTPLNWNCSASRVYRGSTKAVNEFSGSSTQIQKSAAMIGNVVNERKRRCSFSRGPQEIQHAKNPF